MVAPQRCPIYACRGLRKEYWEWWVCGVEAEGAELWERSVGVTEMGGDIWYGQGICLGWADMGSSRHTKACGMEVAFLLAAGDWASGWVW